MTTEEAKIIAMLRCHFQCSFSKLAGLANAVWGDRVWELAENKSPLGRALVSAMERTLGIPHADSDRMVMAELVCMACQRTQWSLCYETDTTKECSHCGKMSAVIPANTSVSYPTKEG
jgi:hypothetical protein